MTSDQIIDQIKLLKWYQVLKVAIIDDFILLGKIWPWYIFTIVILILIYLYLLMKEK